MSTTYTESMTAVFTPPSRCSNHWTYEPQAWNSVPGGLLLQNAKYESQDTDCYPTDYNNWGRAPSFIQIFSPGACPSGYSTAGNHVDGASTDTTTATCCPSLFTYTTTLSSVNAGSKSAIYYGCTSNFPDDAGTTTVYAATNGSTSVLDGTSTAVTTVSGPVMMWALPITVAYQERDLSLFTTPSSTMSPSTSTGSAVAATTSNASVAPQTPAPESSLPPISPPESSAPASSTSSPSSSPATSSGLSTGATAGVAVGAAAAIVIILALLFLLRRQRKQKRALEHETAMGQRYAGPGAWTQQPQPHSHDADYVRHDMPYQHNYDKPPSQRGDGQTVELDTYGDRRHELAS